MNNDLKLELDKFIDEFLDVKEVKQLLLLKKEIEESSEMKLLQEELKSSQKAMALSMGTKDYEEKKKAYFLKKEEYDSHPLVTNYNVLLEEVTYLLEELKQKLN